MMNYIIKDNNIPIPCKHEVDKYIELWNLQEDYVLQENSLYKLFHKTYPNNVDIDDILIKASSLNDFYSTNILKIFPVAKRILELNIDARIRSGDTSLIKELSQVEINKKKWNFYSFATKYCSHHNSDDFPIYDSYVEKVLLHFGKTDKFEQFNKCDLKDYATYKSVLISFKKYYGIDEYSLKDIDRYLWQLGKNYFPKKYLKNK